MRISPILARRGMLTAYGILAASGALAGCFGEDPAAGGPPDAAQPDAPWWECPDPAGQCSDIAPYRFYLRGTPTSDNIAWTPLPTVVGGVQTYHAYLDSQPFDRYDAELTGNAHVIDLAQPDVVTQADREGTATLRLLEPETGRLFNSFELEARPVASVEAALRFGTNGSYWYNGIPRVFAAGAPGQVAIMLYDDSGGRLVDQRLTIRAAPGEPAVIEQLAWDRARITPNAAADVRLSVAAGDGSVHETSVPVIDAAAIDDIRTESWISGDLYVSSPYEFCFQAYSGDDMVVNLPVTFDGHADSNLELVTTIPGCVQIWGYSSGTHLLTGHAGPFSKDFALTFI